MVGHLGWFATITTPAEAAAQLLVLLLALVHEVLDRLMRRRRRVPVVPRRHGRDELNADQDHGQTGVRKQLHGD